jgi:protein-tyrosine sulfotransferase
MNIKNPKNLRKLLKYITNLSNVETNAPPKDYTLNFNIDGVSHHALQTAKTIRKPGRKPAIIIHGMMQRSGTVYIGELLRLHPDIYAYPNEIWEVPFLRFLHNLVDFQHNFFKFYPQNIGKIGDNDFLPLFGSAFIDYLYSLVPEGKQMLLKAPGVQYLNYFFIVFPYESLLLLLRDGRDVVSSTIKTWPHRKFTDVCLEWNYSARMVLSFDAHYRNRTNQYLLVKYEEVVENPFDFVKKACDRFGLDHSKFPFEKIEDLPIRGSSSIKQQGETTWDPIDKPKNFKPIGSWHKWSIYEKQTFKEIAGRTLIDAGYDDSLDW